MKDSFKQIKLKNEKKTILILATLLLASFIILSLFEIILRFSAIIDDTAPYKPPRFLHIHDPDVGFWRADPDNTRASINSFGMHDIERKMEKKDEILRIAIMGDSFMDGAHVGLGHRMSDIIDEKLGDQVEVLNFGITSVGTVQELFIYKSKIRQFNPDLVILSFLTGNDIMNNSRTISLMTGFTPLTYAPYCEKKADGTFQYYPAPVPTERKIKDFLNRYSYSYRFFKPFIKNAIGKVLGYEKYNNPNEDSLLFSINLAFQSHLDSNSISKDLQQEVENNGISLSQNATIKKKDRKWVITDKHNKQVYHVWEEEGKLKVYQAVYEKHLLWSRPWPRKYLEYGVYGPPIDVEWQNAWDITEYTLLEIKKEVEADNAKFLLVILTDAIQIVPNPKQAIQKYTGISPPDDFDVDYPTHRLVRFAKNNSIDCINLLPHFREYAKNHNLTEPYFSFKNDGHWSKLGHRVAANIVINWLKENISALP